MICAAENLNNIYCGASDTLDLIETNQKNLMQNAKAQELNPLRFPQNIVRYHLPVIHDWINQVRAGGDPASRYFADERSVIQRNKLSLQIDLDTVKGILNSRQSLYSQATDRQKQWDIIKKALTEMTQRTFNSCESSNCIEMTSALGSIVTQGEFPYMLLGVPSGRYQGSQYPSGVLPFAQYRVTDDIQLSLENILVEYEKLNVRATAIINDQLDEALNPDKKSVFFMAATASKRNQYAGAIPLDSFREIKKYLAQNRSEIISTDHANFFQETIQLMTEIEHTIIGVNTNKISVNEGLKKINALLQFGQTSTYLQDRIKRLVRIHIQNILNHPNQFQNPTYTRMLVTQDVLEELTQIQGKDQTLLMNDATNAISTYQRIYPLFVETFKKPIDRVFKYWQTINPTDELDQKASFRIKSILCSQLLGQNSWSKGIGLPFCEGTQITSSMGVTTPKLSESYFNSNSRKARVCAYRNMLRQSLILENKTQKPY